MALIQICIFYKKTVGFSKFIDKGHKIINFNKLAHLKISKNVNTAMFLKYVWKNKYYQI